MESHLLWLTLTAGLGLVVLVPHIVGLVLQGNGLPSPEMYREAPDAYDQWPAWVRRANRVHVNYVENVAPFAILVLVAHTLGRGPDVALWAQVFFWARLGHAVVFWAGLPYIRTVLFTIGFIAQVIMFFIVL